MQCHFISWNSNQLMRRLNKDQRIIFDLNDLTKATHYKEIHYEGIFNSTIYSHHYLR